MTMVSTPPLALRELTPAIAPGGRTYVPSVNWATRYCVPPMLNEGGASIPGWVELTVTVYAALLPAPVFTMSGCDPVETLEGTCAFTWPPLMKSTKAFWPPIETKVPSRDVG